MNNVLVKDIIQQLRDVEQADLWLDENFEKKLAAVSPITAFERPIPDMHSIAELMSHLIEWRREVLSRLNGNPRGLEMSEAANWRSNAALQAQGWDKLLADFYASQQQVITFLEDKDDAFLASPYRHADPSFPYDNKYLLMGLIHHDFYHLGQMGMTVKYLKLKGSLSGG